MNSQLLRETRRNLHDWVRRSKYETVHLDKRMEVLMLALADMCETLASEEPKVVDVEVKD
jgi:hypothetical protein